MKRDMSLVRHLLQYIEAQPAGSTIQTVDVPDGTDAATAVEHLQLMIDHGLIDGQVLDASHPAFIIEKLTWQGHDFLQAVMNDTVWRRITSKAKELGGAMTLDIAKELGMKYLKELAGV